MKEFRRNLFVQVYEWGFNHHNQSRNELVSVGERYHAQALDILPYMPSPAPPFKEVLFYRGNSCG